MPIPSSVMIAEVAGGTLNSSAANLRTAVNGVFSGTLNLQHKKILILSHLQELAKLKTDATY